MRPRTSRRGRGPRGARPGPGTWRGRRRGRGGGSGRRAGRGAGGAGGGARGYTWRSFGGASLKGYQSLRGGRGPAPGVGVGGMEAVGGVGGPGAKDPCGSHFSTTRS